MRDYLSLCVANATGQPYDRVVRELSRNKWLDPKQARARAPAVLRATGMAVRSLMPLPLTRAHPRLALHRPSPCSPPNLSPPKP